MQCDTCKNEVLLVKVLGELSERKDIRNGIHP